ncbi:MAG TPA: hypothetical protein VMF32_11190, partial [Xanthobacteraceae bacterium]|nr:hypothetical protein [Xanthobacteraceae bacterium]
AAPDARPVPAGTSAAIGALGLLVLALAVGMPVWLDSLGPAVSELFASDAVAKMHVGWLLVPATGAPIRLNGTFAFISPSKLIIAMPLLALLPIGLLALSLRRRIRPVPVWYGGQDEAPERAATTALTFSNALRTFYSFIYRPTVATTREQTGDFNGHAYFVRRLIFTHDVAPIFGPHLFAPLERMVICLANRLRLIQSGHLNFYLSLIGVLLLIILFITLF